MILGIVSDTHGHLTVTRAAIEILEDFQVDQVIHCGDIGSAQVVDLFARWPTHFVFGNVDLDENHLRAAIANAGQHCHDRFADLEWEGRRIAVLHGDDSERLSRTISDGSYDLVCHGHTHVAKKALHDKTLVINPGALYRANPHSLAIVRLPKLDVTHVSL